ncbi:hypothetical protein [Akkermansia sp.]
MQDSIKTGGFVTQLLLGANQGKRGNPAPPAIQQPPHDTADIHLFPRNERLHIRQTHRITLQEEHAHGNTRTHYLADFRQNMFLRTHLHPFGRNSLPVPAINRLRKATDKHSQKQAAQTEKQFHNRIVFCIMQKISVRSTGTFKNENSFPQDFSRSCFLTEFLSCLM